MLEKYSVIVWGIKLVMKGVTPEMCDALTEKCKTVEMVKMQDFIGERLVIGDSHSMSVSPGGCPVIRIDAKTLYGALKDENYILDQIPESVKHLTLMFGSIDVRHHLLRQKNVLEKTRELYNNYFDLIKKIQAKGIAVEVCVPVPVEHEERKMAATTKFKGKGDKEALPFFGKLEARQKLTQYIRLYMDSNAPCTVIHYKDEWYNEMDPKEFAETVMEKPHGIHIAFPYYRMNNWGEDFVEEKKTVKQEKATSKLNIFKS